MTATKKQAKPLSKGEKKCLDAVRAFIASNDYSPTLQELGDSLSLTKTTIFEVLGSLERKGWITRERNANRSVRLVECCPHCGRGGPAPVDPADVELMRLADDGGVAEVARG